MTFRKKKLFNTCSFPVLQLKPHLLSPFAPNQENGPHEKVIPISGFIDFYIDGDIRWGIEILTKGDRIEDHLARCSQDGGKYAALEMRDYVVLDFRRGNIQTISKVNRDPKRMTVIFPPNNFGKCTVIVGNSLIPFNITLKP